MSYAPNDDSGAEHTWAQSWGEHTEAKHTEAKHTEAKHTEAEEESEVFEKAHQAEKEKNKLNKGVNGLLKKCYF